MPSFLENLPSSLIYQLFLRPFTPEGTLKGAEKMLPHLKRLGVDLIYLTPVCEADDDMNPRFWSRRMLECGFQNPRNPYRVKDYYQIDPEYGSAQDLKDFIHTAHALGMGVLLDVVYIHCGPSNALRTEHPDFFRPVEQSDWPFPRFDLEKPAVRDYFAENLCYFIREFKADGFRADCGDLIPCDFWQAVIGRVRREKPDVIMLNEGSDPAHLAAGFDIDYGTTYGDPLRWLARGDISAQWLTRHFQEVDERTPAGKLGWRGLENHDFVNDAMDHRLERDIGTPLMDCALALNFTGRGVPYLYCGHEIGDVTRHSILGNRFCAPNLRSQSAHQLVLRPDRGWPSVHGADSGTGRPASWAARAGSGRRALSRPCLSGRRHRLLPPGYAGLRLRGGEHDRLAPIPAPTPDLYRSAAMPRRIRAGKRRASFALWHPDRPMQGELLKTSLSGRPSRSFSQL